jgi:histidinol dehydrogenase
MTWLTRLTPEEAIARACRPRAEIPAVVPAMLATIRAEGDGAVRRFAADLDGFTGTSFEISTDAQDRAVAGLSSELRGHLEAAIHRVRAFAERQRSCLVELDVELAGVRMGHRVTPVGCTACYVPSGRAPLPSSAIMGVVPARVAGVRDVVVLSPRIQPVTVAAARLAGADRVFDLGGVHGVAAAAWGLAGVPRADLIVGPGNRYVTAAKRLLYGDVGIDVPAGPSELLVIADGSADPAVVAADLLAQAEHDVDAVPALVALDPSLPDRVEAELERQLAALPAATPARSSLGNGFVVVTDAAGAVAVSEALAPEHLELLGPRAEVLEQRVTSFGSLFLGAASAEVLGDYGSGTNHILPTGGAARFSGGVWVGTFLRVLTWQRVGPQAVATLASQATALAEAEGLPGHAAAARMRIR